MKIHLRATRVDGEIRPPALLTIDGVDVSRYVLRNGFAVDFNDDGPRVSLTFRPDVLDVDIEGPAGQILHHLIAAPATTNKENDQS